MLHPVAAVIQILWTTEASQQGIQPPLMTPPPLAASPTVRVHQEAEDNDDGDLAMYKKNAHIPSGHLKPCCLKRRRGQSSDVWKHVLLLTGGHEECKKDFSNPSKKTHACTYNDARGPCHELLRVGWNKSKSCWNTTVPLRHFELCHKDSEIGKKQIEKATKRQDFIDNAQTASEGRTSFSSAKRNSQGAMDEFLTKVPSANQDREEMALIAVARYYVYGDASNDPTYVIDDPYFRDMLSAYFFCTPRSKGPPPMISQNGLVRGIHIEFSKFIFLLKHVISLVRPRAQGNQFWQGIHDSGRIADKEERLAVGMQFIDSDFGMNHVVCLGMTRYDDGTARDEAALVRRLCEERMGVDWDTAFTTVPQDAAMTAVTKAMEYKGNDLDLDQFSKISFSAIGELVRWECGKAVNDFPGGRALIGLARDVAEYFSKAGRFKELMQICKKVGSPCIRPHCYKKKWDIVAIQSMLISLIRLHKAIKSYQEEHATLWRLSDCDWAAICEFEGILALTKKAVQVAQNETKFLGAAAAALKINLLKKLRRNEVSVLSLDAVDVAAKWSRVKVCISLFTPLGKECLHRARLEAERHFCHNKTEFLEDSSYVPTEHELISTVLDFRTLSANHLSAELRQRAKSALENLYVEYATNAYRYNQRESEEAIQNNGSGAMTPTTLDPEAVFAPVAKEAVASTSSTSGNNSPSESDYGIDSVAEGEEDDEEYNFWLKDEKPDFHAQFEESWVEWVRFAYKIDWLKLLNQLNVEPGGTAKPLDTKPKRRGLKVVDDLLELDITHLYRQIQGNTKFGYLPSLARASRGNIGALEPVRFYERIMAEYKYIMKVDGRELSKDEVDKLVVLRTNRKFFRWANTKYAHLLRSDDRRFYIDAIDLEEEGDE